VQEPQASGTRCPDTAVSDSAVNSRKDAYPALDELDSLREELPGFRIWREEMPSRVRYVARAMDLRTHPHTVITADPGELRAQLAGPPRISQRGDPA
jgi:hypothetical protein